MKKKHQTAADKKHQTAAEKETSDCSRSTDFLIIDTICLIWLIISKILGTVNSLGLRFMIRVYSCGLRFRFKVSMIQKKLITKDLFTDQEIE